MLMRLYGMVLVLFLLTRSEAIAQMAAAQPTQWNIERSLEAPVSRDSVWTLLKDYSLVSVLSNGFVKSIINKDDIMPILRVTTFSDGNEREELLSQLDEQYRFLVYKIKDNSLPKGIQQASIAVFTVEKTDSISEVLWRVIVKGAEREKADFLELLNIEVAQYIKGFDNYLNNKPNTVPAVSMKQ